MESLKRRRKPGRPRVKDKVKLVSIYLKTSDRLRIESKFGRVQDALTKVVLPLCG